MCWREVSCRCTLGTKKIKIFAVVVIIGVPVRLRGRLGRLGLLKLYRLEHDILQA